MLQSQLNLRYKIILRNKVAKAEKAHQTHYFSLFFALLAFMLLVQNKKMKQRQAHAPWRAGLALPVAGLWPDSSFGTYL
jgi:hypothetical protein